MQPLCSHRVRFFPSHSVLDRLVRRPIVSYSNSGVFLISSSSREIEGGVAALKYLSKIENIDLYRKRTRLDSVFLTWIICSVVPSLY